MFTLHDGVLQGFTKQRLICVERHLISLDALYGDPGHTVVKVESFDAGVYRFRFFDDTGNEKPSGMFATLALRPENKCAITYCSPNGTVMAVHYW